VLRALLGLAVPIAVVTAIHGYLWWRLVAVTTQRRTAARRAGTAALVALELAAIGSVLGARALPRGLAAPLAWVGYLWIALMFYLLLALLVLEPVRAVLRRRRGTRHDPGRRLVLGRGLAVLAGVASGATVGYGAAVVAGAVPVKPVTIRLRRLDPRLDGLRVVLLSDVHLSVVTRRPFLAEVVEQVNATRPDLVAVVGDLVDGSVAELGREAGPLADLRPAYGTFFVTGNHEYYSGAEQWCDFLPTLGVRVLRNERVRVERDGAVLEVAGVDDVTAARSGVPGHRADLEAALAGWDGDGALVLLAHQPLQVEEAADRGVDLQLSGHTHGGQLQPFSLAVRLLQPFVAGLHRVRGTQVYVTRGTGTWGPRVRVGAPPEITLVTLRAGG